LNLELFLAKLFFVQNFNQQPGENFSKNKPQEITLNENPTPDNPGWSWLTALGVWLASIVFLVLPSLFVLFYAAAKKIDVRNPEVLKDFLLNDPTAILIQIILVIPAHLLTLALAWAVITKFNKISFREAVGWQWGGFKIWHNIAILVVFFLLAAGLTALIGEQDNDLMRILRSSRSAVYIVAFLATFSAPIVEEVIYRGVIYSAFYKAFGVVTAVIVASTLFAGVHFLQYNGDVTALIMICLLSLVLTLIRVRTNNLLPCIVFHTVFNGIQSVLLILQPYINSSSTTEQQTALFNLWK
jgi:membrane protease YdiL (CAAX protease family)